MFLSIICFFIGTFIGIGLLKSLPNLRQKLMSIPVEEPKLLNNSPEIYSEDVLFISRFFYSNHNNNFRELEDFQKEVNSSLEFYKKDFIETVLESISYHGSSHDNIYQSLNGLFFEYNFLKIVNLNKNITETFELDLDENSILILNNIYYNFLFHLLKDLYNFKNGLPKNSPYKRELIKLFRETKEELILTECINHINTCTEIQEKFKIKNLDNYFQSIHKSNLQLTYIDNCINKVLSQPDDFSNLEFKVIVNTIKSEILPKIEEYEKQNTSDDLSKNTLNKIVLLLDQSNKKTIPTITTELEIINRYLDNLNNNVVNL